MNIRIKKNVLFEGLITFRGRENRNQFRQL